MGIKYIKIDIENNKKMEIFHKFYKEIIVPNFSSDERETEKQFKKLLKIKDEDYKYYIIVVIDEFNNILRWNNICLFIKNKCRFNRIYSGFKKI